MAYIKPLAFLSPRINPEIPMSAFLESTHYDLITPDGTITDLKRLSETEMEGTVFIEKISPLFVGFHIDPSFVYFNIKSTLAQVGLDGIGQEYHLDFNVRAAEIKVLFRAIDPIGKEMLKLLKPGAWVGKLFAADERRRVRDPDYLSRMFGRSDRWGQAPPFPGRASRLERPDPRQGGWENGGLPHAPKWQGNL